MWAARAFGLGAVDDFPSRPRCMGHTAGTKCESKWRNARVMELT